MSGPRKNPYLTQYKNEISEKQKVIRERLGVQATSNSKLSEEPGYPGISSRQKSAKSNENIVQSARTKDTDSIPSIDDEENNDVSIVDRNYRSKASFFSDDAEESLQFFKKNLLTSTSTPNAYWADSAQVTEPSRKLPATSANPYRPNRQITAKELDYRPRITQNVNDRNNIVQQASPVDRISRPQSAKYQYAAKGSDPPIDRSIDNNSTYKPLPIKQTSFNDPRSEQLGRYAAALSSVRDKQRKSSERERRQPLNLTSTEPIETQLDSNTNDVQSDEKSELNEFPAYQSADGRRSAESSSRNGSFSRKPLYNSLLRAHDSIRLKINKPKGRTNSENKAPPKEPEANESGKPSGESHERAVDVKRSSSRRSKKKDKKEESETPPVRNFTDVRVIKITRTEMERSLGVTVRAEDGNIVVARIMAGSLADKQGALQVGDFILAVNGREVYTPEQLQEELRRTINEDTVMMKIVASYREELPTLCIYLRALFAYDPNEDSLLPCKEVGVAFNQGDILEVVNQEDPNWWQARRVDSENLQTGLIPSQELEERRRAFVSPDYDLATRTSICGTKVLRKSKRKEIYNLGQNNDFDKAELQLYEEVCRTPAFERRTMVLIGANGVGKQALKARLVTGEPDRFGAPLAHTSRLPRDGEEDGIHYHFVTRERMEEDIIAGLYLEYGEYDGALYGTKLDSVREIIGSGKVCVLDCSATCLKILKTPDYLPFVAFIGAPTLDQLRYMNDWARSGSRNYSTFDRALNRQSRRARTLQDFAFDFFEDEDLQLTVEESARLFRMYENYFDIVLINNNFERTYELLREAMDALSMTPQWIPISWIYSSSSSR